jgi:hypothetical protein
MNAIDKNNNTIESKGKKTDGKDINFSGAK